MPFEDFESHSLLFQKSYLGNLLSGSLECGGPCREPKSCSLPKCKSSHFFDRCLDVSAFDVCQILKTRRLTCNDGLCSGFVRLIRQQGRHLDEECVILSEHIQFPNNCLPILRCLLSVCDSPPLLELRKH